MNRSKVKRIEVAAGDTIEVSDNLIRFHLSKEGEEKIYCIENFGHANYRSTTRDWDWNTGDDVVEFKVPVESTVEFDGTVIMAHMRKQLVPIKWVNAECNWCLGQLFLNKQNNKPYCGGECKRELDRHPPLHNSPWTVPW